MTTPEPSKYIHIRLTNSKRLALIDRDMLELVFKHTRKWHTDPRNTCVMGTSRLLRNKANTKGKTVRVHQIVMNYFEGILEIDHINGDPFDNRKENLRLVTSAENSRNQKCHSDKVGSKYKGITYNRYRNKYYVSICKDYKSYYGGLFADEKEAARKANELMIKLHGEHARLNIIPD